VRPQHKDRAAISVSKIEPNKFNPNVMPQEAYEALVQDMKMTGDRHDVSISPIIVSPKNVFYNDPAADPETYVIIDGEHRWRAAKELGWQTIPCELHFLGEDLGKVMNYRRNRERGTVDPLKEAELFKSERLTQQQIALKYNVSQPYVANRLRLLKLSPEVVEAYQKPDEKFKELQLRRHEEELERWKEREKDDTSARAWVNKPEKPDQQELIPRGIISPSHLEAISTLPEERQIDVVRRILTSDVSAKETERIVQREKQEIAEQKRFKDLLEKAVTKTCPRCGLEPRENELTSEGKFRCSSYTCHTMWDPFKPRKELEAEIEAQRSEEEKRRIEELKEKFKEARENPSYIKLLETPEELSKKIKPWLLRKIQQLTEISKIDVSGKRNGQDVTLSFEPPTGGYLNLHLSFSVDNKNFGFNVESKQYKRENANSRVNLGSGLAASEKSREILRRFFREIVETEQDPLA